MDQYMTAYELHNLKTTFLSAHHFKTWIFKLMSKKIKKKQRNKKNILLRAPLVRNGQLCQVSHVKLDQCARAYIFSFHDDGVARDGLATDNNRLWYPYRDGGARAISCFGHPVAVCSVSVVWSPPVRMHVIHLWYVRHVCHASNTSCSFFNRKKKWINKKIANCRG